MEQLKLIRRTEEEMSGTTFRKDRNTIPRIINLAMQMPDALKQSHSLPSRQQLENKEGPINKREIWVSVADDFNDATVNSGGIIKERNLYSDADIDPEKPNTSGLLTSGI